MKKRLLSYLLAAAMIFTNISVVAETDGTETTDTIECTLSPENYAVAHLSNTGYADHLSKAKLLNLYYNTPYTSGSIYTEFGSVISSYRVPLKTAIETMSVSYQIGSGSGIKTDRYVPVFYDTNKFSIDAEAGLYTGPRDTTEASAEYASAAAYADNYWCGTGTTTHDFKGKSFENQVAYEINTTTTGYVAHDVSQTALTAYLADADEEYITFATGREVSGYTNAYLNVKSEEEIPTLTLTYSKSDLLELINATAEADVEGLINDLGAIGVFAGTTNGYDAYSSLIADAKSYVNSTIYETIANGGFESLATFYTAYDESVSFAQSNGTLIAINNVTSAAEMKAMLEELGAAGSLDGTACGYDGYKELISVLKEDVINGLYAVVEEGEFAGTDEFYTLYESLVSEANTEFLNIINSEDTDMDSLVNELGELGLLDKYAENPYSVYNTLNDDMKLNVTTTLHAGGFENTTAFYEAYDKAVIYELNIEVELMPENRAVIHITRDGYADHEKNSKLLGAYYNIDYSGSIYAEFGSLISGYRVDLKDIISEMKVKYYVAKGGMQSGRTIPLYYDFNMFAIDAEAGYYKGATAATDTTEAVEATQEYNDILEYTKNYWPESGYNASGTAFASQVAHNILETTTGTKVYDMTDTLLDKFIDSGSDSITFATGRETSEYANGSFSVSTQARIPKLVLTYDTYDVLEKINSSTDSGMAELIDQMGRMNMLERGEFVYEAYTELSDKQKARVSDTLYEKVSAKAYTTFDAFVADFYNAVDKAETKLSYIAVSDSEKKYDLAEDAAGKTVTISAPVHFAETSGTFTAILAEYADGRLVNVKTDDVSYTDTEIEFTHTLSEDVTDVKLMVFDSLSGMKPLCESVSDRDGIIDGKKILFIGNSHVYRGMTVIEKELSILDQESRSDDTGYFYQLCKANGYDVSITNWTFSGHGLFHIFGGNPCTYNSSCNGKVHEDYLIDRDFDYVCINSGTGANSEAKFMENVTYIMDFFEEENPDVKFVLLANASSYGCNATDTAYTGVTDKYAELEDMGVIIADWGRVVTGIIDGDYTVPGANYDYTKSSFIVSDQYHANALTGYITTLTAYCAVTGESAVGQPYEFCTDSSINSKFDMLSYANKYYTNGASDTNFDEIFESESDIRGIQSVVDEVIESKAYRNNSDE